MAQVIRLREVKYGTAADQAQAWLLPILATANACLRGRVPLAYVCATTLSSCFHLPWTDERICLFRIPAMRLLSPVQRSGHAHHIVPEECTAPRPSRTRMCARCLIKRHKMNDRASLHLLCLNRSLWTWTPRCTRCVPCLSAWRASTTSAGLAAGEHASSCSKAHVLHVLACTVFGAHCMRPSFLQPCLIEGVMRRCS